MNHMAFQIEEASQPMTRVGEKAKLWIGWNF